MIHCKKFALVALFVLICSSAYAGEAWAPYKGYSSVNQDKAYNNFYFQNIEGVFSDVETYEHETQVTTLNSQIMMVIGQAIYLVLITIRLSKMKLITSL